MHPKKCRELIASISSWERLEWCSAAKKCWWYNEYLKNGLVLSQAKFFNFISWLGRQTSLKTTVLPDHPTCSVCYLCQSLKFSLYPWLILQNVYFHLQSKKDNILGKGGSSGRTSSHVMEKSNLTWNNLGIQTLHDCSRKREGMIISSLEWNEMSQTNTGPRSFIIIAVISEL